MIAPNSKSYPYLAIAQKHKVDYGSVLCYVDALDNVIVMPAIPRIIREKIYKLPNCVKDEVYEYWKSSPYRKWLNVK